MFRLVAFFLLTGLCLSSVLVAQEKPNIVIILADDMGWGDPQCYQPESKIPTPNIDRLATGGMRFTDAHTPSSVCTPTRYTLLTGRYCWRTRLKSSVLDGFSPPLIEPDRPTIARFLQGKGCTTACIGKWHIGMQWTRKDGTPETADRWEERGFRPGYGIDFTKPITEGPLTAGFDSYFGISASLDMPPYCWIENDLASPLPDSSRPTAENTIFLNGQEGVAHSDFDIRQVLPTLKQRAVEWIETNGKKDKPFFLYMPLNSPHLPVAPSPEFQGKSEVGHYGDFVMETDDCVGGVLDALESAGVSENTLVLFTSDNGGLWHQWTAQEKDDVEGYKPSPRGEYTNQFDHHSNAFLRGTKADIWEGGHRVPFLVQWPASVEAGKVSDEPVELTDVFATVMAVFDEAPNAATAPDSFSFLSVLRGESAGEPVRPYLVHHSLRGDFAVRKDGWKYVERRGSGGFSTPRFIQPPKDGPQGQLYHVAEDVSETKNLWDENPERVEAMGALLEQVKTSEVLPGVGR